MKKDIEEYLILKSTLRKELGVGMIKRLYKQGVKEVLFFVADGVTGLEERIKEYFPKVEFQSCVVHKEIL